MIVKQRGCVCREGLLGRRGGNKEHSVCETKPQQYLEMSRRYSCHSASALTSVSI